MSGIKKGVIYDNILWNVRLMLLQIGHAKDVGTRARSGYYKMAILAGASVVEALVYLLLSRAIGPGHKIASDKQPKEFTPLPSNFVPPGEDWVLCKRKKVDILLTERTDLIVLNRECLDRKVYGKSLFNHINKIREMRNKIHLQGLEEMDRCYQKKEVDRVSGVAGELFKLL